MSSPGYRAPDGAARAELRERGSRFRAVVGPAASEDQAREALAAVAREFPGATHHCWAWRIGDPGGVCSPAGGSGAAERSSDAGEPVGTAGAPILHALRGSELSDVVAVVARWFGGTKLGKGCLARAYAAVTREAVSRLPVTLRVPTVALDLELPYDRLGAVQRLVHPPEVEIAGAAYGERVRLTLSVHCHRREEVERSLADLGLSAAPACRDPSPPIDSDRSVETRPHLHPKGEQR